MSRDRCYGNWLKIHDLQVIFSIRANFHCIPLDCLVTIKDFVNGPCHTHFCIQSHALNPLSNIKKAL